MQQLGGEIGNGLLTPSITTPAFVRYTRGNVETGAEKAGRDADDVDLGCTIVASIDATDRDRGRDGAREIAGMYLANKVQNIQGSADTLLELAEIEQDEIRPVAEAMEQGGRLAAKAQVSDSLLDKCKPIAGTPSECIAAIEEYRDAGCTHIMLELWGDDRHEQIRLFGSKVLPHFRPEGRENRIVPASLTIDRDRLVGPREPRWSACTASRETSRAWPSSWRRCTTRRACAASGSRSRTAARTRSGSSKAPEAGRTSCSTGTWTRPTRGARPWLRDVPGFQPD